LVGRESEGVREWGRGERGEGRGERGEGRGERGEGTYTMFNSCIISRTERWVMEIIS